MAESTKPNARPTTRTSATHWRPRVCRYRGQGQPAVFAVRSTAAV